jgi:RHS repeat-associated protein
LYSGSSLTQWNVWGLDNVGKINADTTRNYYLKDHLGSIRVVLNSTNTVISAQDYDAWGYVMENRSYNSIVMKYDFTGKERDSETSYDYFGARYYDSRIANWTSIDPLFEKHFDFTPYNYVLRNPIILIDPDGRQGHFSNLQTWKETGGGIGIAFGKPLGDQIGKLIRFIFEKVGPYFNALRILSELINNTGINTADFAESIEWYSGTEIENTENIYGNDIVIRDEDKIPLDQLNPPQAPGLAPTDKETGLPIEIHHVGQNPKGPFKEMKQGDHRGKGNKNKNHDPKKKSTINRNEWKKQKGNYWKNEWDKGRFNK